jgi:hypothetical protein
MSRRSRSLSALEILLRQTKADPELDAYPLVRANLLTRIRALQRLHLTQDEQDVALGQVLDRRFLLLAVPAGRLRSPESMNLVVRVQEQIAKANGSRRRRAPVGRQMWARRRAVPARGAVMDEGQDNDAAT